MRKQEPLAAVPASIGDPVAAAERANALVTTVLAGLLKRQRSIAAALMYVLALGRDVRANCWDLSEKAGLEPGDGRFHRLLERYRWSWERGREMLPLLAQEALGTDPDPGDEIGPGLAVDETTDLKRGTATACVSPQHSGVTGKTENCVTWVFSALVTATGQAWAWFDLYMPECWAKDPARRKRKRGSRRACSSRPSRNWRSRRSRRSSSAESGSAGPPPTKSTAGQEPSARRAGPRSCPTS